MHWKNFDYQEWQKEDRAFNHPEFDAAMKKALEAAAGLPDIIKDVGKLTRPPWKPNAYYNRDGDQLEVWLSDEESYARWICPGVTVYLSMETEEVVGVTVEGIKRKVQHHTLEIKEEAWEADERIITIDGAAVGRTLSKQDAKIVEQWLQSAKSELWTSKSLAGTSSKPPSDSSATNATPSPTEEPI